MDRVCKNCIYYQDGYCYVEPPVPYVKSIEMYRGRSVKDVRRIERPVVSKRPACRFFVSKDMKQEAQTEKRKEMQRVANQQHQTQRTQTVEVPIAWVIKAIDNIVETEIEYGVRNPTDPMSPDDVRDEFPEYPEVAEKIIAWLETKKEVQNEKV